MPGIRLYVSLLQHFENVTEATNVNLVASVLEVMEAKQTANVYDIVEQFDRAVDPVTGTFKTLKEFISYFKASLQYEVIRKKSKAKGATGRAWRKAYDSLSAGISRGKRLTLSLVEQAIKLAESHLREQSSPSKAANQAAAEDVPAEGEGGKKGHHAACKANKRICELEAKLAKAEGKPDSALKTPTKGHKPGTGPSTPSGPRDGKR